MVFDEDKQENGESKIDISCRKTPGEPAECFTAGSPGIFASFFKIRFGTNEKQSQAELDTDAFQEEMHLPGMCREDRLGTNNRRKT